MCSRIPSPVTTEPDPDFPFLDLAMFPRRSEPSLGFESHLLRPLLGHRLRALMVNKLCAPRLLLGSDRCRVFTILGNCRHRLFDRRPRADLIKPALDVGKFA